jgi:hypothetical protein
VHGYIATRTLRRRAIAIAVAYAIALSSLLASFGSARAAAEAVAVPGGIICHTLIVGQESPAPADSNGKMCADCCCVGCTMPMAAVLAAPPSAAPLRQVSSHRVGALQLAALAGGREAKSHRSRAPPLTA